MRAIFAATIFWILSALTPTAASTFNYDVSINLGGTVVTGNIETSCDACLLTGSNIVGYYFQASSGNVVTGGGATTEVNSGLLATSTGIYFVANTLPFYSQVYFGSIPASLLSFTYVLANNSTGQIDWECVGPSCTGGISEQFVSTLQIPPDLQIAQFTSAAYNYPVPTPLPSGLPLFAGGLGLIVFFAWRNARKKTPIMQLC